MRALLLLVAGTLAAGCAGPKTTRVSPSGDTADSGDSADTDLADTGDSADIDLADTGDSGDTAPWTRPDRPDTDHPATTDSWRWGGGHGYPDVVDPTWPVVTRVSDLAGLTSALAAAASGDVVYVEDTASIDLTGQSLCIPGGVWLASDRGVDDAAGGLLYATAGASVAVLKACGDDVRVTGLRLRGPDPETCPPEWPDACPNDVSGDANCAYCTDTAYAIDATDHDGLEVDNNELSGWTYAGVGVHDSADADVHHNWIHHHWREGLGYGVVLFGTGQTDALIRWNRFDAIRHAVAGQGYPDTSYEARDNLMGTSSISHVFDMHGENEADGSGASAAGDVIDVHDNIVLVADQYSFVVRGRPATGAWFYDNCVSPSEADATDQRYYSGNFSVGVDRSGASAPNTYGASASTCGTLHWCLADDVVGPPRYGSSSGTAVTDLLVGDLDGDGHDDVFGSSGSAWRWANPDGGTWASLASTTTPVSVLALADLDGDGVDDVFYGDGSSWRWSRGGAASWATLRSSPFTTADVGFGDFDGDGAQDVFVADGARWHYYPRGSGAAVDLASSSSTRDTLAFGDFDGDGVTDVFSTTGSRWRWSRSGSASWADLASSSTPLGSLGFADVDGDHVTDVLTVSSGRLLVSSGGRTSWGTLRYQVESLDDVRFGDFDGDGRVDVLTGGCL